MGFLRDLLWGMPMLALLLVSGGYFTVRTGCFQAHPLRVCKNTIGRLFSGTHDRKRMLEAVATALGGTVGVGSITGVAYGIAVGGAGSIFWMWVSGFTGMALKYAEVYLAVAHRKQTPAGEYTGGTPFVLRECGYGKLGILFALLCVCASFGVGNLAQIGGVTEAAFQLGLSKPLCGVLSACLLAYILHGGRKRIGKLNAVCVPVASLLYLVMLCIILCRHFPALPGVFARILREAFGLRPAIGGTTGAAIAHAMREGFARGVFSNEAGVGSSPLAHASSGEGNPMRQGEWGAFEILGDTFTVSTLTALALLCTEKQGMTELFGSEFGQVGRLVFLLLMAILAFASILSWCYYSEVCLAFLDLPGGQKLYRVAAVLVAGLGGCVSMPLLWEASDILNALMILPNLFLLFHCRKEISYKKERVATCGIRKKKKKCFGR